MPIQAVLLQRAGQPRIEFGQSILRLLQELLHAIKTIHSIGCTLSELLVRSLKSTGSLICDEAARHQLAHGLVQLIKRIDKTLAATLKAALHTLDVIIRYIFTLAIGLTLPIRNLTPPVHTAADAEWTTMPIHE